MSLKSVDTKKAPGAVGPYSQAIAFERFCFTSGQLPINPETGVLISDDIEKATEQSIKNVEAILNEAGFTLEDVVKTTIFVKNMKDFSKVNGIYEKYFSNHKPARSCVEVSSLPKDGLIEIEAIAYK